MNRRIALVVLSAAFIAAGATQAGAVEQPQLLKHSCQLPHVIAHRGFHKQATENTVNAVNAAERLGVTGVEVDVRTSADGVPVLMHDATVNRTTHGSGKVSDLSWSQLRRLGVDRLSSAVKALDHSSMMLLEIKAPASKTQVTRIVHTAQRSGKHIVVESFDRGIVAQAIGMGASSGLIVSAPEPTTMDVDVYSPAKMPVFPTPGKTAVWTLDSAKQWQQARAADYIITNRPDAARQWRNQQCS